ncbi:hypothetical protein [Nocardia terpenica]|uniref:Uncharacterized protein n=1 Tax=Nocardia terpenica TaxID=455432 RepID=A0A291RL10_9NOCA|nr:hypothetical protein [Nocardia terpenica]ATL67949.1 hypothetical protein CRH09_18870 [Nocardia terpenica]
MRATTDPAARLRGGCVGASSGAVSMAAHAFGGGTVALDSAAAVLLLLSCTVTGVVVTALRRGMLPVLAMLAVGQAIGHAALSVSPRHCHGGLTAAMLAAHVVAIAVGALLIRGAEIALGRVISSVRRAVVALGAVLVAPVSRVGVVPASRGTVAPRLLVSSGIGRRGPPRLPASLLFHHPAGVAAA